MTSLSQLNAMPAAQAEAAFLSCCGSREFAARLAALRPFANVQELLRQAGTVWSSQVGVTGWLEAFAAHPRIGDKKTLAPGAQQGQGHTEAKWCEGEQAAASNSTSVATSQDLAQWNAQYESKFGHVFLIRAQGRSAAEILEQLKARFSNPPLVEIQNACREQGSITELRLLKLLQLDATHSPGQEATGPGDRRPTGAQAGPSSLSRLSRIALHVAPATAGSPQATQNREQPAFLQATSAAAGAAAGAAGGVRSAGSAAAAAAVPPPPPCPHISTHVLDTVLGRPGAGIAVALDQMLQVGPTQDWVQVGAGQTNADGRCGDLLLPEQLQQAMRQRGAAPLTAHRGVGPLTGHKDRDEEDALHFRLHFQTGDYFARVHGGRSFFPAVTVEFELPTTGPGAGKVHVPLLLAPFSYSTYRGS